VSPYVSVVIPTGNRWLLLDQTIRYIARQETRFHFEAVVVDGGREPVPQNRRRLWPEWVRYFDVDSHSTIGDRRNLAIDRAEGEIIVNADDDDWYHRQYLQTEVSRLVNDKALDLVGIGLFPYYNPFLRRAWHTQNWIYPAGATHCFRKSTWARHPYPSVSTAEDKAFCDAITRDGGRFGLIKEPPLYVYMRHFNNVTGVVVGRIDPETTTETRALLGDDLEFYDSLSQLSPQQPLDRNWHQAGLR
jgi:glycosyltransferase involved in cell wall biosynthesis